MQWTELLRLATGEMLDMCVLAIRENCDSTLHAEMTAAVPTLERDSAPCSINNVSVPLDPNRRSSWVTGLPISSAASPAHMRVESAERKSQGSDPGKTVELREGPLHGLRIHVATGVNGSWLPVQASGSTRVVEYRKAGATNSQGQEVWDYRSASPG
jgi:hypothetical protein